MHLRNLVLLAGASAALAEKICYTALAEKAAPAKLATEVTTTTTPCTSTVTKHVTVYKSPKPKTTTVTTTSTNTVTSTSTETATETETTSTDTETDTVTESTTETQTQSTVVTSTSTVPTSDGFIPVKSSLPNSGYDGTGGSPPLKVKRDHAKDVQKRAEKKKNPQKVDCVVFEKDAKCKHVTSTTIKTIIHTTPATKTQTVTETTDTTEYPSATTTITVSTDTTTTTTTTTTETQTETTTTTNYAPSQTVYAACASNNIVDQVNGKTIGSIYNYAQKVGGGFSEVAATSAYDCCVAGLFSNPYPGAVWQYRVQDKRCFINNINPANYPKDQSDQDWEVASLNTGTTLAVGNLYYAKIDRIRPGVS